MRAQGGDSVISASETVTKQTKELIKQRREIDHVAELELNQPGVTQAVANKIASIKLEAARLAARGGEDLAEGMQAVVDFLSNR